MRGVILLILLTTVSCTCKKDMGESAFEMATGGKIDRDGKQITITGEDGEKITANINDDGESVTTVVNVDGKTATMQTGKVPEGFPLPIFEGSEVAMAVGSTQDGSRTFAVTLSAPDQPADVGAFYEKALKDKGLTVKKNSHAMGGTQMVVLSGTKGTGDAKTESSVSITSGDEGEEGSMVQLTWKEPE